MNHSYSKIIKSISRDEKIAAAIRNHYGLRILEQGIWECTASFIISAFSNIPRIRQCIESIAAAFGNCIEFDGFKTFSFPQPQQISDLSKLKKCGLGYRAKYLFETAKIFSGSGDEYSLRRLRRLGYEKAKEKLLELPGVGSKVADCILLFSCGFYGAFPVDVWVKRAMIGNYSDELSKFAAARKPKKVTEKVIAEFARSYFGGYAGYAQQFLYHHARTQKKPVIYLTN
ncbi:DNA repair protein [Candidatus Woesearchaeota archaeon]|nr:DNA repair protein [Candidatus Woesearchaeota archaeon]